MPAKRAEGVKGNAISQVANSEGNGAGKGGLGGFTGPRTDRVTKDAGTGTCASVWKERAWCGFMRLKGAHKFSI